MNAFIKGFSDGLFVFLILGFFAVILLPFSPVIMALLELMGWIVVIVIILMIIGSFLNLTL